MTSPPAPRVRASRRPALFWHLAASLRPELEKIDGFISIERFSSLTTEGKILSLSIFKDEEAVQAWRNLTAHRMAQAKGRGGVFSDYDPARLPSRLAQLRHVRSRAGAIR